MNRFDDVEDTEILDDLDLRIALTEYIRAALEEIQLETIELTMENAEIKEMLDKGKRI